MSITGSSVNSNAAAYGGGIGAGTHAVVSDSTLLDNYAAQDAEHFGSRWLQTFRSSVRLSPTTKPKRVGSLECGFPGRDRAYRKQHVLPAIRRDWKAEQFGMAAGDSYPMSR